ncbi:hypothetical protein [Actinomadura sp. 6K520]|uniref:hypothetical protein n=1 Tax=Actinomadura sp. 6K520 TaxID=2530364 RepID=UPI00104F6A80|nr:hypothetical protein [Actinomadura sp. 6K520]TDE36431.1 hypothetical protein E1289_06015 [Actinomadura sp. 6K520]
MSLLDNFIELLQQGSAELHVDNPGFMRTGELKPTANIVDDGDLALFFAGLEHGLITLHRGARFNTLDRPTPTGHWALLSRSRDGGWYNAEYLPQIAAYVDAIINLRYPAERVLFELPSAALQLDLAILDDESNVVVLGEAKRDTRALEPLREGVLSRFADKAPGPETKKRGDEHRQLAWRLWTVRPRYTWLIGPGHRAAFVTSAPPLQLTNLPRLPAAEALNLAHSPARVMTPPALTTRFA